MDIHKFQKHKFIGNIIIVFAKRFLAKDYTIKISVISMNKKNLALIFLIIFFVAVTIMGNSSLFRQIGITNVCSKCHTMEPYCESYLNPQDYPLIYKHKNESVSCIDCHSAPGSENRDKAYITISKIILSYIYTGNAMVDTSPLRYDCVKCHEIDTSFYETAINPHAGAQSCDVCHLTHRNLELGDFIKMDCADCHVEPNMIGTYPVFMTYTGGVDGDSP